MYIRKALPLDETVPLLMLQAMEDIVYLFIGKEDKDEAILFLFDLFKREGNQYSYENTFVAVDENNEIIGSITAYDGDLLSSLRTPVLQFIQDRYDQHLELDNETDGDELYIDTIAVAPNQQGKGVGSSLLRHLLAYAKENSFSKVGLLVDFDNPDAQRLYERTGFQIDSKKDFAGGQYFHMIYPCK
jgi:ribosomal protein S18 acetylase RimI-like enzyme